jgi:hypothetical protein
MKIINNRYFLLQTNKSRKVQHGFSNMGKNLTMGTTTKHATTYFYHVKM